MQLSILVFLWNKFGDNTMKNFCYCIFDLLDTDICPTPIVYVKQSYHLLSCNMFNSPSFYLIELIFFLHYKCLWSNFWMLVANIIVFCLMVHFASKSMSYAMLTSSNGNIVRITGLLWGESIGHRWIPLMKASDVELWCFLWSVPEQTVEQTIEMPVIWDAVMLIMTSL